MKLVVFYSRTGNTKKLAKKIAEGIGADIDEIEDGQNRKGPIGFLKSGFQSLRGKKPKIDFKKDPSKFDITIIGTPVWGGVAASPVQNYLRENKFKKVAFFASYGGSEGKVFQNMEKLCNQKPIAKFSARGSNTNKLEKFVKKLNK